MPTLYAIACLNGETISRTYPDVLKPFLRTLETGNIPVAGEPRNLFNPSQQLFDPSQEIIDNLRREGAIGIKVKYDEPFTTEESLTLGCKRNIFTGENQKGTGGQGGGIIISIPDIPPIFEIPRDPRIIESEQSPQIPQNPDPFFGVSSFSGASSNISEGLNFSADTRFQANDELNNAAIASGVIPTTVTLNASFCSPEGPKTSSFGQVNIAFRDNIAAAYKAQLEKDGNKNVVTAFDSTPPLPTNCSSSGDNTIRKTILKSSFCNKGIASFREKEISTKVGPGDSDSFFNNFVSIQSVIFKNELKAEGLTNIAVTSGVNPPIPNCNTTRDILLRASFCNNGEPAFRGKAISTEVGPGDSDSFFNNFVSIQSVIFKNELKAEGLTNIAVTSGVNPPIPNCNTTRDILLRASFCNNGEPAFRGKAVSTEVGPGDSDTFFKNFVSIQSIKFKNELKEEGFTNVEVTAGVNPPTPNCGGIPQVLAAVQFQECDGSIISLDTPSAPTAPSVTINGISISLDPINKGILGNLAYSYKSNTSAVFSKPGVYTVTFGNVPGWVTPNPAFFTLNSANDFGGGNEANRIYTRPNCDDGSGTTGGGDGSGTPPSSTTTTTTTSRPTTTTTTTTTRFIPRASWLKQINPSDNRRYVFDVTEGLFSNNIRNLTTFFTGSTSENYSRYYTHVYDENPKTSLTSSIQFSIAYGHSGGSGSLDEGNKINITPTRAIYSQYRNLILGKSNIKFNLTGRETDSIYVINYQSKRLKDRLDAGVIELNIAHLSGSQFLAGGGTISTHTGSNVKLAGNNRVLRLIDDSKISTSPDYTDVGYSYNIVSGTLETGVYNQTAPHYYGKLIPSLGVVILDGNKLDLSASFATSKASEIEGYNAIKLYKSFSGSALVQDNSGDYLGMKARRVIREYNDYYFIRVLNNEYNFTNNVSRIKSEVPDFMVYKDADPGNPHWKTNIGLPLIPLPVDPTSLQGLEDIRRRTLLKLENGEITEPFANNSQVYITTVGLYNAQRELIAVGKLPKPILKNFTEESIFTVKLKY